MTITELVNITVGPIRTWHDFLWTLIVKCNCCCHWRMVDENGDDIHKRFWSKIKSCTCHCQFFSLSDGDGGIFLKIILEFFSLVTGISPSLPSHPGIWLQGSSYQFDHLNIVFVICGIPEKLKYVNELNHLNRMSSFLPSKDYIQWHGMVE